MNASSEKKGPQIALLCSGGLGLDVLRQLREDSQVEAVLTDRGSTDITAYCERNSLPCFAGNPRDGRGLEFLREFHVEVLASVNYLFIIEQDLIDYPTSLAFNVHGSLLPRYRGRTPHVWSIINNETEVGITAHELTIGCDEGDILEQVRIPLEEDDTGASVLTKYRARYYPLVEQVLAAVEQGTLKPIPQDESKATWFGKRVPEDGEINWEWCRERIRNWVRAQASPYPGAFTFFDGQKVIIDRVSFDDAGFQQSTPNGTLLRTEPKVLVKTPNGALAIDSFRGSFEFRDGGIFAKGPERS